MKIEPIFEHIGEDKDFTGNYRITSAFFPENQEIIFQPFFDPYTAYIPQTFLPDEIVWDLHKQLEELQSHYEHLQRAFNELQQQHIARSFRLSNAHNKIKELEGRAANENPSS